MTDTGWKDGERTLHVGWGEAVARAVALFGAVDPSLSREANGIPWVEVPAPMQRVGRALENRRTKRRETKAMRRRRGHTRDRAGRPM